MADQIDIDNLVTQLREAAQAMNKLSGTAGTGSVSSKDTNRLIQALARLSDKFDRTAKSQKQRDQDIEGFIKEVDKAADNIEALAKATQEQDEAIKRSNKALDEQAARAALSAKDLAALEARERRTGLNELAKAELAKLRERQDEEENLSAVLARARLDEIKQTVALRGITQKLGDTLSKKFGIDVVKTQMAMIGLQASIKKLGEITKTAYKGLGDIAMGLGSMTTDLGDGAKGLTQFNGLIDTVTGALGDMLKAIPVLGDIAAGATKLGTEGFKFVLDQAQELAEGFTKLGDVGALTAGGLEELKQAQLDTGVPFDIFEKALIDNANTLARFGGTVGSGTQKFTKVLTSLTKQSEPTSLELRRLGFTLADITEATSSYIDLQNKLGLSQRKREPELAEGARQYVKELDILTKLTGKSRKDIQAQQEAAQSEGRFRAVLDDLAQQGPAGEKAAKSLLDFQTRINSVSPELAQAIRDVSTGFTNSEAAVKGFNSTSGQLGPIIEQLKSGAITQDEAYRRVQSSLSSNVQTQKEYAKAMGDDGPFIKLNQVLDLVRGQAQSAAKAQADQTAQMQAANSKIVESTVNAQVEMEKLSISIKDFAFRAMEPATRAVKDFAVKVNEFIAKISDKMGIPPAGGTPEQQKDLLRFRDLSEVDPTKDFTPADLAKLNEKKAEREKLIEAQKKTIDRDESQAIRELTRQVQEEIKVLEDKAEYELEYRKTESKRIEAEKQKRDIAEKKAAGAKRARELAGLGQQTGAAGGAAPAGGGAAPAGGGGAAPAGGALDVSKLFTFTARTGDRAHFDQLDPGFKQNLINLATDYYQSTGKPLTFSSGFRSPQEQADTPSGGLPKAEPGKSLHQYGRAADLNSSDVRTLAQMGLLDKYGFKTLDGDPPHIFMRDGGVVMSKTGGTSILAGEGGQNEAVVPLPNGRSIPVDMGGSNYQSLAMGLNEIAGQLSKLIDLQNRSNKISEKLVRVSTN